MATMEPPSELVHLVAERRVIPFVGAGLSTAFGYPVWRDLLETVAAEVCPDLHFSDIRQQTNDDNLKIAEFLYLKAHRLVGPIRHTIERALPANVDFVGSSAHVELANLGAPQIYTTNYDEAIESALIGLNLPVNVVTLPRDIATADHELTQVVKFHGDLRHDETLVLTESSYYRRMDLESPMDLKFRADLLGKSVLFMGYSFNDINIRMIWFRLMDMMKGIPEEDRPPSYILRPTPNQVLQTLDHSVGLKTIVLDPSGKSSSDNWGELVAGFLQRLSSEASPSGTIPGRSDSPMRVSSLLINRAGGLKYDTNESDMFTAVIDASPFLHLLSKREIPSGLLSDARAAIGPYLRIGSVGHQTADSLNGLIQEQIHALLEAFEMDAEIAEYIRHQLTTAAGRDSLQRYHKLDGLDWTLILAFPSSPDYVRSLLSSADQLLSDRRFGGRAEDSEAIADVVYVTDLLRRVKDDDVEFNSSFDDADWESISPTLETTLVALRQVCSEVDGFVSQPGLPEVALDDD